MAMKKFGYLVLSILFAFSFACVPAFAAESGSTPTAVMTSDSATKEMVLEKSIQAFPEYAEKIRGENLTASTLVQPYSMDANEIVVSETRALSENEMVHYTEYANGIALTAFMTTAGKNVYQQDNGSYYTVYHMNAWLTCGASSDLLMIYGVQCRLEHNGNNGVPNPGYIEGGQTSAISPMRGGYKSAGTAGSPAYVEYSASFTVNISTGGEPIVHLQPGVLRIEGNASVKAF